MKSGEYWKARFNDIEQKAHDQGATCFQDIEGRYSKAIRQLTEQILSWYQRFADNNEISLADARKWLNGKDLEEFRWTVKEYIRYGQENAVDGQWIKQLENASSRYHISRLEALKTQLQQQVEVLHGGTLESLTKTLKSVYSDSYYRAAFEVQKGVGVGWSFDKLDQRLIDKVINNPWSQSGDRFSDVIWKDKKKLLNGLETDLTQGLILGKDPQKVIDSMSKKLNTSKSVTGRLVMTESAFFSQQAQHDAFGALGVEKYEIVATLDSRTSELCRWMDGKVFKRSEWEVGVTAPPFHPWCRTTTVPYFDDEFDVGERAARDEDGNAYYVPANMTYKDWEKAFVNGSGNKSELKEIKKDDTVELKTETAYEPDTRTYKRATDKDYSRMAKAHKKNITKREAALIHKHNKPDGSSGGYVATHNYSNINSNLRGDGFSISPLDEDDTKTIDALRDAIARNVLDGDYVLTRYVNGEYLTDVFGVKGAKYSRDIPEALDNLFTTLSNPYVVNDEIPRITQELRGFIGKEMPPNKAFLSTSLQRDRNIMRDKAVLFEIHAPSGTHCYIPKNKKESECILGENQRMLIENVEFSALVQKWIFTVRIL